MMPRSLVRTVGSIAAVWLALLLTACQVPLQAAQQAAGAVARAAAADRLALRGRVEFGGSGSSVARFRTQATLDEVATGATVSLIDAGSGNTVASSISDASGSFFLAFDGFNPQPNVAYTLEAVKGLSVANVPNQPGAAAVRVRTFLYWSDGWQSLTNSTPGSGILISPATTALAVVAGLRKAAGQTVNLLTLVNKVSGNTFSESGTGLTATGDFNPVLALVGSALELGADPLAAIAFDPAIAAYRLSTPVPGAVSVSPRPAVIGSNLTVTGAAFDAKPGRTQIWFGSVPAATWSFSADRRVLTVPVPGGAVSAPLTLQQPGNVTQILDPFLYVKGTVGTFAGDGTALTIDGPRGMGKPGVGIAAGFDSNGEFVYSTYLDGYIRRIDRYGYISTIAGTGVRAFADGVGAAAAFNIPIAIVGAAGGNLFVSDMSNNRIRKITPNGTVSTFAGNGTSDSSLGNGTAAGISAPIGLALDRQGNLYCAEWTGAQRLLKITPSADVTVLWAGPLRSYQLALDPTGNYLITGDINTRKILRVSLADGSVTTLAGSGVQGVTDGAALSATLTEPVGLAVAPNGDIYFSDYANHRIRRVSGGTLTTVIGATGINGNIDGPAATAGIYFVHDIAFDPSGTALYLAEAFGAAIRVYVP